MMLTASVVQATDRSSYRYGWNAGRDIAEAGKAYELGPECSSVVNPEVTNVTACGDGYVNGYSHFVSKSAVFLKLITHGWSIICCCMVAFFV